MTSKNRKFWTEIQASSKKDDWETPQFLFDALHSMYNFTLDACASHENAKLPNYYTKEEDALIQKWGGRTFCNPPYNRSVGKWAKKAYEESLQPYNELVCLLIPARVDTSYWHEYIFGKAHIIFLRGRLKFEVQGYSGDPATFPSAIVVYGTGSKDVTFKEQGYWEKELIRNALTQSLYKDSHYHEMPIVLTGDELIEELKVDCDSFSDGNESLEKWASDIDIDSINKDAWYQTNENLEVPTLIPKEILDGIEL